MKTCVQPGPEQYPRLQVVPVGEAAERLIEVEEGADLLGALCEVLTGAGFEQAGIRLLGGRLARVEYYTGVEDPSGGRVATYGPPTPVDCPALLLAGNAILGRGAEGEALVHCHAVLRDRHARVHGGHLNPGGCRTGRGGVRALACAWRGPGFAVRFDPETNYPVFHAEGG